MRRITLKDLQALANELPLVGEREQRGLVGGGTGSNMDPFTQDEYQTMLDEGTWNGGFVLGSEGVSASEMRYIPSSLPESGDHENSGNYVESDISLFENHQMMTMSLEDAGQDGEPVPSGYWTDSGYWTGSGYLDGYYDESGVWITSGSWSGSFEYGSGVYNSEDDCYEKEGKIPELTITAYGSSGGPSIINSGDGMALDLGVETGAAFNDFVGDNLKSIIDDRTKYMSPGEVANRNIQITIKMPVGTIDVSQKLLTQLRQGTKLVGWAGIGYSVYESVNYYRNGQWKNGTRKLVVTGMQFVVGTYVPGGIAISYLIGVTDTMIGY